MLKIVVFPHQSVFVCGLAVFKESSTIWLYFQFFVHLDITAKYLEVFSGQNVFWCVYVFFIWCFLFVFNPRRANTFTNSLKAHLELPQMELQEDKSCCLK